MLLDVDINIPREEIYKKALEKWGKNAQTTMVIEEIGEFTERIGKIIKLICHQQRIEKENMEGLIEEIADHLITVEQYISVILDIESEVKDKIKEKLKKLKNKIESEEN